METENIEYRILGTENFLDEIQKLVGNEVVYVADVKNFSGRTVVYHMMNTTLMASPNKAHIIGQLIDIEKNKKHLENKLNIELKI
jgi:hypothetical protein